MVLAAKTTSQIALHMCVAFGVMYAVTGSLAFGGIAAVIEPVLNVVLLPLHERFWRAIQRRLRRRPAARGRRGQSLQMAPQATLKSAASTLPSAIASQRLGDRAAPTMGPSPNRCAWSS
jgi:uncharacterized membrane protein